MTFKERMQARIAPAGLLATARSQGAQLAPRLMFVTILLVALLHAANALFIYHFYSTNAAHETETRDATATLLANQAGHALTAVDLTLDTIAAKLHRDLAAGRATAFDQALVHDEAVRLTQVRQIMVLDREGRLALDSKQYPAEAEDLSKRPYFSFHQNLTQPERALFIGKLIFKAGVEPHFSVSRGIFDDKNNLVGVAVALVEPTYFAGAGQAAGSIESMLLVREDDGSILAGDTSASGEIGADTTVSELLTRHPRDIVTVRHIAGFPLQMIVTSTPPSAAPAFRNFVIFDALLMALVTLVALGLAYRLTNEVQARSTAESRLRDAIEATPGGFALYDQADRLVLCNRTYVEYFPATMQGLIVPGTKFETLIRTIAEIGGWGDVPEFTALPARVEYRLAAHREAAGEIVQHMRDDRWLLTRERRTKEGGTACFYTDITRLKEQEDALRRSEQVERQAREVAERADRTKSAFLATMSHELRTPLNAVIGFSQIIEQGMFGPQPARYREYAKLIRRSGEHLLTIINDILDIAKLQSGKTELRLETVALGPIVDETVRLVAPRAEEAGLALTQLIEPNIPPVRVDVTRIKQVLLNLLSNAIKFTPSGGRVAVTARTWEGAVVLSVSDTGIGMNAADIPKALEPFGQVANAMTRAHEGTGLGLPLSKSLIELHGGNFEIASAYGAGTTVTITLPAAVAETGEDPAALWRGVG